MISEPELEGEDGGRDRAQPPSAPETPREPDGSGTVVGDGLPTLPPQRVRWLWALGGAVVASAVWAGGLYAYDRTGPDLRGYRISEDLCLDADLSALSEILGGQRESRHAVEEQRAIDRSFCDVTMMPGRPGEAKDDALPTSYSSVTVNYSLHKETDPAPEFEATLTPLALSHVIERKTKRIPELGERAYLMTDSGGYTPELKVLDGRAVFSIGIVSQSISQGPPADGQPADPEPIDPAVLEPAMVEDMKALMAAVKE
ncbi:hypothetical protein OG949_12980 [Streptomyces scopuliridis]|uniref:hypothetical protein n=1 Tax=Streptomyces scopuliridis TaxID=452529 RepID=UPI002DDBF792|nr:hypothetical protein [Streptomyces scopuliridis]WSB33694.1 hypothetical protein OG949_12980 [Streptomyces scopuliridis]